MLLGLRAFEGAISEQLLRRNVKRFRGRLVFKAHRRLYHSTLGLRVIKKKDLLDAPGLEGVQPESGRARPASQGRKGTTVANIPSTAGCLQNHLLDAAGLEGVARCDVVPEPRHVPGDEAYIYNIHIYIYTYVYIYIYVCVYI